MKLAKNHGGSGSLSYSISIGRKEALAAGLIDENGESYDVEKFVNDNIGSLCIRRTLIEDGDKRVSRIIREYKETLLSGEPAIDYKGIVYWIDGVTLYEKAIDGLSEKKAIAKVSGSVFTAV